MLNDVIDHSGGRKVKWGGGGRPTLQLPTGAFITVFVDESAAWLSVCLETMITMKVENDSGFAYPLHCFERCGGGKIVDNWLTRTLVWHTWASRITVSFNCIGTIRKLCFVQARSA